MCTLNFKQKKETRTAAEIDISVFNGARQSYDVKLSIFGCLTYSVYPHIITHFFLLFFLNQELVACLFDMK